MRRRLVATTLFPKESVDNSNAAHDVEQLIHSRRGLRFLAAYALKGASLSATAVSWH